MFEITKIKLNLEQIAGSDLVIVTDVKPVKEYIDGKPTEKVIGYRYLCITPDNNYQRLSIKVLGVVPLFTEKELKVNNGIKVKPIGFKGKIYKDNFGNYKLSAVAENLEVIV